MDRRIALKNIGLSFGYVVATPTLISIVQSCNTTPGEEWTPDFFTMEEGVILIQLVDIIIPKTDTPSASELNVHVFIDKFVDQVMYSEKAYLSYLVETGKEVDSGNMSKYNRGFMRMTLDKFTDKAIKNSGKEAIVDLTPEDLESVLASSLKMSKEQEDLNNDDIERYVQDLIDNPETAVISDEIASFAFANYLREMTIWGYKSTEYVAEEVLAYLPIPGEYIACEDADKLTGGKAWSL